MEDTAARNRIVLPGDYLCVPEEYMPGQLTYVEGGEVRAAAAGIASFDVKSRRVSVKPLRARSSKPGSGDIVIGVITALREDTATVSILMDSEWRPYGSAFTGLLHVSQASKQYTKNIADAVRLGDLVRVRILKDSIPMHVSMRDAQLGVLAAYCSRCGSLLEAQAGSPVLRCPRCGNTESRKLAPDYIIMIRSGRRKNGKRKQ